MHCKGGYLREENIIDQLLKIIDQIDVNEFGMRHKFEEEVKDSKIPKIGIGHQRCCQNREKNQCPSLC